MLASHERVFYYHGDASPIGGALSHPYEAILHSHGSVSLSQAGGHHSSRVDDFKLDSLIHCKAAYSQATGSVQKESGNWTTLVTSVVEDLNVLEVVTANRIVSIISVEHPRDGYYPKVSFVGSQFENLRIGGLPVSAPIDLNLLTATKTDRTAAHAPTEGDMLSQTTAANHLEFPDRPWTDVTSFIDKAVDQSVRITTAKDAPEWLKRRYEWVQSAEERTKKGYVISSLVDAATGAAPGSTFGHVVTVPGFGNIFLGELAVTQLSFQLVMLRIELGCQAKGTVSFAAIRGNGLPVP